MSVRGTAVVTGAGSGIGRAVAIALAARGHEVVVTGRRTALLHETVAEIVAADGTARAVALDVTDEAAVDALFRDLSGGRLDVVVANAGSFVRGPVLDLDLADWSVQVDVNLTGAFLTLRAAGRLMREQDVVDGSRGHLFTLNSGAGVGGYPTGSGYSAAKHGVRGLVESLRPELAPLDIKVTDIVVSATVDSEMSAGRDVPKIPASTVGHTIVSCLDLPGSANWDRVDLAQIRR